MTGSSQRPASSDTGLFEALVEDGRPLLTLTGVALLLSGAFAIFLAARREFLPHDIAFLGLDARDLCVQADCRIVAFMFHDRVAFGGTLIAIGTFYLWLTALPLRDGERWAWQAILVSGIAGFLSFLAYFGYGYLDSWHGVATLAILPCFAIGLGRSRATATRAVMPWLRSRPARAVWGRWCLLATGAGMILAGATILVVGMTQVFVPQDLAFMRLAREDLAAISPRLIPLIAHDRAGFGGGLLSSGLLVAWCAWHASPSRAFTQTVAIAGAAGFGCALGVHYVEGYTDGWHLAPAWAGALLFTVALVADARARP
jgi:hypothetical protein